MKRRHQTRPVRSSCVRGRGTEKSAEDLVGPPEWMESERRSTAVVRGDPKHSRRQPNGNILILDSTSCGTSAGVVSSFRSTCFPASTALAS